MLFNFSDSKAGIGGAGAGGFVLEERRLGNRLLSRFSRRGCTAVCGDDVGQQLLNTDLTRALFQGLENLNPFHPHRSPLGEVLLFSHFTAEETETQGREIPCPGRPSRGVAGRVVPESSRN